MSKVLDVFTERTIEKMDKHDILQYFRLMLNDVDIPTKNKITLMYLKIKDYEQLANQEILDEAVKRRDLSGQWRN